MIDRYLIRYFLAVVDHGNFSRAAAHSNVSQPTLSVGIAKLERLLGAALFFRSNQRVQLTESGNKFLAHARRIEREFNLAQQALNGMESRSTLRLGLLNSIPARILAEALGTGDDGSFGGLFEFIQGSERELTGQLSRGRLDVALTLIRESDGRFLEQPILDEGYVLAMPGSHRFATAGLVEAQDLSNETMIVRRHCEALAETSRHFVERGVRPHFAMRSTNDERVMLMIAAGLGLTVMPESYRCTGVAFAKLAGFFARRTIGLQYSGDAHHMRYDPPPLLQSLISVLATLQVPTASSQLGRGASTVSRDV